MSFLDIFKYFSPVVDADGSPCRDESEQLVFCNKKDGSFISFPEDAVDMTAYRKFVAESQSSSDACNEDNEPTDVGSPSDLPNEGSLEVSGTVWFNTRTEEAKRRDKEATSKIIEIAGTDEFQAKLRDKRSRKSDVWSKLGESMANSGFQMPNTGQKCHQKWRNLERDYRSYLNHKKGTGNAFRQPPEFTDDLEWIFGARHTNKPVNVRASYSMCAGPSTASDGSVCTDETSGADTSTASDGSVCTDGTSGVADDRETEELPKQRGKRKATTRLEEVLGVIDEKEKRREELLLEMEGRSDDRSRRLEDLLKSHHQERMARFDRRLDILEKK